MQSATVGSLKLKDLEKMKMVILEKKHFPRKALDKVVELAKTMEDGTTDNVEKTLYILGGETGRYLKRFLIDPESFEAALEILFGVVKLEEEGNRIVLENCRVCDGLEESRACNFVSGLINCVLEDYGSRMNVKKEKKVSKDMSCSFSVTPVVSEIKSPFDIV
jgi:predicted hydrocarbon binding protein